MKRFGWIVALTAFVSGMTPVAGADLELVKDGVSQAPIVVFAEAPPLTRAAAVELADYMEKVSGARPKILEGTPEPLPEKAIWVGYQPKLKELFPKLDFDFKNPEEILIAANENHLVIVGRDRWNPDHLVVPGIRQTINGKQMEYGTANAVYTFLQDQLKVRWLWPGPLGEDLVRQKTIAVPSFEHRFVPPIRGRDTIIRFSALGNSGYGRSHEWTRYQRLQLSSIDFSGGHAFTDWWERFSKDHPEYFALQPDGTRSGYPNPRTVKICQSNPAVWQQWLKDVEAKLKKDPNKTTFSAAPNDGWYSGHCVCEHCSAWDHPDGEPRKFVWDKHSAERPALTDRDITFANKLAALLKERYPEKNYYVVMNSYGHSRPAPVAAKPADNVIISSVANFMGRKGLVDRGSPRGTTHREQYEAWCKNAPNLVWRPNTGSPAGWQQGLPDLYINELAADLKFFSDNGGIGIFIDTVWEHWGTQGPQYYAMAQLAWNPNQDVNTVMDDYYKRGFGPAAEQVKAYYQLMERARSEFVNQHGYETGRYTLYRLYSDELLKEAKTLLDQAAEKLAEAEPVYRERLDHVAAGLEMTRLIAENCRVMGPYWRQKEKDQAVADQVRRNWQAMEQLAEKQPWAVQFRTLKPNGPRMVGLHPDHPPSKTPKPGDLDLD